MFKDLILKLFTYPLCIGLLFLSSWLMFDMTDQKPTTNIKEIIAGPFIFLSALTYLITDIIVTIKTFRKNNNNDNPK